MDAQNLQPHTKFTGYFKDYLQTEFILEDYYCKALSFLCALSTALIFGSH